jgi:glutamate synthase domain-containing protein 1/glutamate synthase domain-containing protein 3
MCGIAGIASTATQIPFKDILKVLKAMEFRGTEQGAGFAAHIPVDGGFIRFKVFAEDEDSIKVLTEVIKDLIISGPDKVATFNKVSVYEYYLSDYPPQSVYNSRGVWVLQTSKYLNVWKGVGWPYTVAEAYRLHNLMSNVWIGHTRYPTNSPGFKPWLTHPFTYRETVIVHNGDLSSYGINKRYIEFRLGINNFTGNDSESIAYLMNILLNDGYRADEAINLLCTGEVIPEVKLDGPFAVIFIHGTSKGPIFGAFVDNHHLRPLYVAFSDDKVYVASEAGALKALDHKLKPLMLRGGGMVILYPDGEKVVKGLTEYKVFNYTTPQLNDGINALLYANSVDLNKAIDYVLRSKGYAIVYNLLGHRYVANGLGPGYLELIGVVGNSSLNLIEGLDVRIYGQAQEDLADCAENSRIVVYGDVGDAAAQAMRSGELHVLGNAGNRLGVQLRGGVVVVRGDVGDYLGEYMAGGTIVVLGSVGKYVGTGMVGGKIYISNYVPLSNIGKAPPKTQVERYLHALVRRGKLPEDVAVKALNAKSVSELSNILHDQFRQLSKLWGILHVGYPHAEYRYLRDYEELELRNILMNHVLITKIPLNIDEILLNKFTIITAAKYKD